MTPSLLNGWIGVDLFFVLSGFLIGRQAWRGDSLPRFWFKRVTRILPAYWTCLAIVAVMPDGHRRSGSGRGRFSRPRRDAAGLHRQRLRARILVAGRGREVLPAGAAVRLRSGAARSAARSQACVLASLWVLPIVLRGVAAAGVCGQPDRVVSYVDYFPGYRSPFHLTCESLVLGFAIAWLSLQTWSPRFSRPPVKRCSGAGAAAVLCWLVPSVILRRIDARTIVLAPALIGLALARWCLPRSVDPAASAPSSAGGVAAVGDRARTRCT